MSVMFINDIPGVVTIGDVVTVQPFGNEIDMIKVTGENLLHNLEISVRDYDLVDMHGRFLQMSGRKIFFAYVSTITR